MEGLGLSDGHSLNTPGFLTLLTANGPMHGPKRCGPFSVYLYTASKIELTV